jgi:hypothetical protein
MADLFAERVKAFALLRNSLATIGEPQGMEAYRERLKIQAEVNKEALLDAESQMARIKMQAALAEQKYGQLLGFESAKMEMMGDIQEEQQLKALMDPELQEQSALAVAELPRFEDKAGLMGLRDLKPGQQLRFLGLGKKFKPENILNTAAPQIQKIMSDKSKLQALSNKKISNEGPMKTSLMSLVMELKADLSEPYVQEQMQKKGTEQQQNLYNQYMNIVNDASTFLNQ